MPTPYSSDTHQQPPINVNLKPCDCPPMDSYTMVSRKGAHFPECPGFPILIPCRIPPSVMFEVAMGTCTCPAPAPGARGPWVIHGHRVACPAHPVRVACSISGKTWAESEAWLMDDFEHAARFHATLTACRDRWALVKALVLGLTMEVVHGRSLAPEKRALFAQRDAVYAALADLVRAERALEASLMSAKAALPSLRIIDDGDEDSRITLETYVSHLIEQIGVMP